MINLRMKSIRSIVVFLATLVALIAPTARLRAQQSTSAEAKAKMIQLISDLEMHPYSDHAKTYRSETLKWLTGAPDVSVTICPALFGDFDSYKGQDGDVLFAQMALSQAKFILAHPDKASDKHAVWLAGVEGVLATYEAMKAEKPKVKIKGAEGLADVQRQGKLSEFIDTAIGKCSK